jgi:hypothetical protein
MARDLASLLLAHARLDRKRTAGGLDPSEGERLAELSRVLTTTLTPNVPPGAERRSSFRVPAEIGCQWAPLPAPEPARITMLSRSGAFVRTTAPAPVGADLALAIALPVGGVLQVPGSVANHLLGPDPERRGMGIRFGRLTRAARQEIDALYEQAIVRQYGAGGGALPTSG